MANERISINLNPPLGFCGVLTITFVVFKLLGNIDWSWWWVFGPMWIPIAAVLAILAVLLLTALLGIAVEKIAK